MKPLIPIADIVVGPRLRQLRPDTVAVLAESIAAQGLLHPIAVRKRAGGHELVAGRHRLEAARQLGHATIAAEVLDDVDADRMLLIEIDENLIRADLSPAERAAHQAKRKELYEALHPETKRGGDRRSKSKIWTLKPAFIDGAARSGGRSRSTVAQEVARGRAIPDIAALADTPLDKGDELDALAQLPPDEQRKLIERAVNGERVSAKVRVKQFRRAEREQQLATSTAAAAITLGQEIPPSVIVVDWALRFKVRSEHGEDRSPENHYPCGTAEEMIALKPPMADDAVVFAWTNAPQLANSMAILRAWDITYKSYSGWDKIVEGTGYWGRSVLELLLIGTTKGSKIPAPAPGENFPQLFRARKRKHSEKPDEVYAEIERLFPNLIKLEMFARKRRQGWRTWGNEIARDSGGEVAESQPAGGRL